MKKAILGIVALFVCLFIGLNACQKEHSIDKSSLASTTSNLNQDFADRAPDPKIKIKGKLHRNIETRPRDGKKCDCKACFGVCDVTVEVEVGLGLSRIIVEPNSPLTGKATIYFLDFPSSAEPEFVIDVDQSVPSAALQSSAFSSLVLKSGTYSYNGALQYINDTNGQTVASYGKVVVDMVAQ